MPQFPLKDRDLTSLKIAARAAIVIPANFAIADKLIGDPQTAIFASFGSFALLVLADFAGSPGVDSSPTGASPARAPF